MLRSAIAAQASPGRGAPMDQLEACREGGERHPMPAEREEEGHAQQPEQRAERRALPTEHGPRAGAVLCAAQRVQPLPRALERHQRQRHGHREERAAQHLHHQQERQ